MVDGGGYLPYLERLVEFASTGAFEAEVKLARKAYFAETGVVREDEPSFEARMEAFTEWYVLDRPVPSHNQTPLEIFLAAQGDALDPDALEVFRAFRGSSYSLFEFLKAKKEHLVVRDITSMQKRSIFERRNPLGLEKGAIFGARVLGFRGHDIFTQGILHHPREARKLILAEAKRLRDRPRAELGRFFNQLSRARLRCDNYRRVDVERLYRQILAGDELAG